MVNPTKSKLAAVKTEALKAESIKSFMLHLYIQKNNAQWSLLSPLQYYTCKASLVVD